MNRIFKHYHLSYNDPSVSTKLLSFSSYPGVISSLDDFYILDSGLMMIQTTNSVLNYSLYDSITPNALSAWQRVRLANTLASSGKSWYETVRRYNSGTYNNQYMIIDLKLFTPKEELKEGLLWVIEQIPGLVVGEDLTNILKQGYWSSYNVPYFKTIYEKSGYSLLVEEFVSILSGH